MLKKTVLVVIYLATLSGCSKQEYDQPIPVSEVPEHVLKAAQQALPGITITEAEKENPEVYDLSGTLDGIEYELDISLNGVVYDIEKETGDQIEETEIQL